MQAAALSDVDVGGALVTSISTGEIRKFVILWDRRIQELPIEQDLEDYFVALVRFWHANGMDFSRYLFDLGVRPDIGPGDNQMICTSEVMDADMRVEVRCMGRRH